MASSVVISSRAARAVDPRAFAVVLVDGAGPPRGGRCGTVGVPVPVPVPVG